MIVVTGMHRSGTSAISQLMRSWGVDFGPDELLLAADRWNERGYLEAREVVDLNSRILTGFPRSAGGVSSLLSQVVYLTIPSRTKIDRRAARRRSELVQTAESFRERAVKDPRFCLTLGYWRDAVPPGRVVVCLRSPAAVAASLKRRQRLPLALGYRFWDWHCANLVAELDRQPTRLVRFQRLFGDDALDECRGLARFLNVDLEAGELEASYDKVFARDLVHFEEPSAVVPGAVEARWRQLTARAEAQ